MDRLENGWLDGWINGKEGRMSGIVDEWIDAMRDDHRGSNSPMREW